MSKPMSIITARKRIEELKKKLEERETALRISRNRSISLLKRLRSVQQKNNRLEAKLIRSVYADQV